MNEKVDAFLDRASGWQAEMRALRAVLRDLPLKEDLKWRQPCYTYNGGNICILSCLKRAATVSFLRGALLRDPYGVLEMPGPNSRAARFMCFASVEDVAVRAPILRAYVAEAMSLVDQGRKVDFTAARAVEIPDELSNRFDADPDFHAAFAALTPGRQRGYLIHFTGAKRSDTRARRIDTHKARIMAGKGLQDR